MRNDAHLNMSSVFREDKQLILEENSLTVLPGFLGGYPNALLQVNKEDLAEFVSEMLSLTDEAGYSQLLDNYGIRRTNPQFVDIQR